LHWPLEMDDDRDEMVRGQRDEAGMTKAMGKQAEDRSSFPTGMTNKKSKSSKGEALQKIWRRAG